MKIAIGDLVLVDTSDGSGAAISDLRPAITRVVQEAAPLRAEAMIFFYRGNRKTEISFRISRPNSTPAVAFYQTLIHDSAIPSGEPLVITPTGSEATITIAGELRNVGSGMIGSRTFHDYAFVGGAPVASGFVISDESGAPITDESGNPIVD